ncbi:MAG: two-component system response regulator [Rariglobus sp.]|jgi:CheY-like chemotaxis protein|nr:two-component system response regulator [Rariglobus sp.]
MTPVPHILLAENDTCLARLLLHALKELHPVPKVVHVPDGEEALDHLHARKKSFTASRGLPSVVILDLKMPKIGGLEVLRQIKGNARLRLLPVVMLTSSQNEHEVLACYESGANACVVKPIGFQQLMAVVRQLGIFWTQVNRSPPPPGYAPLRPVRREITKASL